VDVTFLVRRLFSLPATVGSKVQPSAENLDTLEAMAKVRRSELRREVSERNARFFEEEAQKLDDRAEEMKVGLERELKEMDRQIKDARRPAAAIAPTLEEKLAGQKALKALEPQRNQKRRTLFDAQDDLDRQREALIQTIEGKLEQDTKQQSLITIAWSLA
jgi:exonuclease VII large subunit